MASVISDLKSRARMFHREVLAGEPRAVERVQRRMPELCEGGADALRQNIRRRHCLSILVQELGFRGWQSAVSALSSRPSSGGRTIARFVIGHGRVVSESRVSSDACDRELMSVARDALARLRSGAAEIPVEPGEVSVGLGPLRTIPAELLDRMPPDAREQYLAARETVERRQGATHFYVRSAGLLEPYILVLGESADLLALSGLYGALAGSFLRDHVGKPGFDRERLTPLVRRKELIENAAAIVRSAPAFVCSGRLSGSAAAFADCFALAMLSEAHLLTFHF